MLWYRLVTLLGANRFLQYRVMQPVLIYSTMQPSLKASVISTGCMTRYYKNVLVLSHVTNRYQSIKYQKNI